MNNKEIKNTGILVTSRSISKIGNIIFDYANNSFLAGMNLNSTLLVGIYQSSENIISVLFNLFGGVVADRFHRKKILIITDLISGVLCILLSFISSSMILLYSVIGVNIILSILSSFSGPTSKALTKEIVESNSISKLNSILETFSKIIMVATPIVAVGIVKLIGIRGALLLDGISFLTSSFIIFFITPIIAEINGNVNFSFNSFFTDIKEGFEYLYKNKKILRLITLSAIVNFILAFYNLLLPYGNVMFPHIKGNVYAIFLASEAIGGIVGAILASLVNRKQLENVLYLYLGIEGLFVGLIPFIYIYTKNIYFMGLGTLMFSVFLSIFNVQFFSMVQNEVDNEFLGRVFSIIFTVAILFMPVGTILATTFINPSNIYNFVFVGLANILIALGFNILARYKFISTK